MQAETVFAGDSMIEYFDLAAHFTIPIGNHGIAGDTTSGLLQRIDEFADANKIFLLIGTNDLTMGHSPEAVSAHIKTMVSTLRSQSSVFIISIIPVNEQVAARESWFNMPAESNQLIEHTNLLLRQIAREENVTFIDAKPAMIDDHGLLKEEYTVEGLHLSPGGYKALASELLPWL